jgi:Delta carbonic anhydrase
MKLKISKYIFAALALASLSSYSIASDSIDSGSQSVSAKPATAQGGSACEGFGPQTPRDIDNVAGENKRQFSVTSSYKEMNLCNIHFHENAEHKARDFSIFAGAGEHGGYQCSMSKSLTKKEMAAPAKNACKDIMPGDTIEVHWVHTSCDVTPGEGLGSCLSANCANPDLRVETQVYTVVNDPKAVNFNDLTLDDKLVNGYYQAKSLPTNTGKPVEFLGSTTGPKYTDQQCSPLQVAWSVRPQCAKVDINSLSKWCESNAFKENHPHGVRTLVTNPKLLSKIK